MDTCMRERIDLGYGIGIVNNIIDAWMKSNTLSLGVQGNKHDLQLTIIIGLNFKFSPIINFKMF